MSTANVVADKLLRDTLTEAGIQPQGSGYTYIDGTMLRNAVSRILAGVIGIERVVRPRICGTEEFTAEHNVNAILNVTVELDNFMGIWTRSLGPDGTPGKNGLINFEAPVISSTVPFNIPLTQLNDQPMFFPRLQLVSLPYDRVVKTLANYAVGVSMSMDAYHLAKVVASVANYAVSVNTAAPQDVDTAIVKVTRADVYDDSYMARIYNQFDAIMAEGDPTRGVMTYTGPRGLVCRPEFINWSRTPKNGWLSNASDIGQIMVLEPTFDWNEAKLYGSSYKGDLKGYHLLQANNNIWHYVEQYLDLDKGDLSKVLGVIMTPQAYAMGGVAEAQVMLLQSTDYAGVKGFPFHKFGGAAYRKMVMVVESDFTFPAKLTTGSIARVAAPASWAQVTGMATRTIENILSDGQSLQILEKAVTEIGKSVYAFNVNLTGKTFTADAALNQAGTAVDVKLDLVNFNKEGYSNVRINLEKIAGPTPGTMQIWFDGVSGVDVLDAGYLGLEGGQPIAADGAPYTTPIELTIRASHAGTYKVQADLVDVSGTTPVVLTSKVITIVVGAA